MDCRVVPPSGTPRNDKRASWRGNLHHDGGGVVAAGILHRHLDEALRGVLGRTLRRGRADELIELAVPQAVDETVRAEEKTVAGLMADRADMGFNELVAGAEGLVECVAPGMVAGLAFVELALAPQPADVAVVVRDLGDAAVAREVIDAAVAKMGEIHPLRREPPEAEGGAHAGAFLIGESKLEQVGVDLREQFPENFGESAVDAGGREAEGARQQLGDAVDGDEAGEVVGFRAAHVVDDGEGEIRARERGLAGLAEVAYLVAVEAEREEGILIVGPDAPAIGEPGPTEAGRRRRGGGGGGVHGQPEGFNEVVPSPPSSRVANSKSMMQKRPSVLR